MYHHAFLLRQALSAEASLSLCPVTDETEVFVSPESEIGIGEVRALTIEASRKPREVTNRLIVVRVASLTFEAQQALLKLLEEPPVTTSFLFIVPPEISLLSTLTSRFFLITTRDAQKSVSSIFEDFVTSTPAARLEEIGKRTTKKDTIWIEAIKSGLKEYLIKDSHQGNSLSTLSFVLAHLNTRGASNKLLLEELALSVQSGVERR